jgi:lipoate-protein ligase A
MLLLTRTSRAFPSRALPAYARALSGLASASSASAKTQVYVSRSRDPYLNLSIEHHLLQKTPSDSTVLFLYTNRPCVVIGRNQNPWLEVNLPLLNSLAKRSGGRQHETSPSSFDGGVELVRRRSGGGTVFHDEGNMNFSVICPPSAFDRDKHAEMIVRALQSLGVGGARVNCRHDIVVDVPTESLTPSEKPPEPPSCRANAPPPQKDGQLSTFKVSGSAYKLTRLRSLHHGTCLLSSPNLKTLGKLLRSPAEPFIKGRGVDSVRSPVRNVGVTNGDFEQVVVDEFGKMYGDFDIQTTVGDEEAGLETIAKGLTELRVRV